MPLVSPRAKPAAGQGSVPSANRPTHEHPLLGRVVGNKYGIRTVIGEGGMGTVYEAEHLTIGRRVAIKVLNRAHLGRREAVARFHQEARAAGAIGHPNICEIYDVGNLDDGSPYLVMECLHGRTLADRINLEGALPFEDVIMVLTQVLSALVAAHEKNIIHRDVKPENIFLSERVGCAPVVKILDFGISKFEGEEQELSLTRTGMVMGTPFYMAPEQARGEPIDHRVDAYACGVILYEALTGRRPFLANNYNALVVQILATQPRDPREIRPAIPAGFVPIIFKALSKKREDRYRNAEAFLKDLLVLHEELGRGPVPNEIARLVEEAKKSVPPPSMRPSAPPLSSDSIDIPVVFSETGTGAQPAIDPSTAELLAAEAAAVHAARDDSDETMVDDDEEISAALAAQRKASPRLRAASQPDEEANDTIVDPSGSMLRDLWAQMPGGRGVPGKAASGAKAPRRAADTADATQQTGEVDDDLAEEVLRAMELAQSERPPEAGRYSMVSESDEETYADEPEVEHVLSEPPRAEEKRAPERRPPRGLATYMALAEDEASRQQAAEAKPPGHVPDSSNGAGLRSAPRPSGATPIARVQPVPRPVAPAADTSHEARHRKPAGPGLSERRQPSLPRVPTGEVEEPDDDAVTTMFVSGEPAQERGAAGRGSGGLAVKPKDRAPASVPESPPPLPRAPRPPRIPRP